MPLLTHVAPLAQLPPYLSLSSRQIGCLPKLPVSSTLRTWLWLCVLFPSLAQRDCSEVRLIKSLSVTAASLLHELEMLEIIVKIEIQKCHMLCAGVAVMHALV